MRAQAALCSGAWATGACTTTAPSLVSAPKEDPEFRFRREQLMSFAQIWESLSHRQRHSVAQAR
eukprot:7862845-Pyramimonas_sp.AAC.1